MKLMLIPLVLLFAAAVRAEPNCWAANVVEPVSAEDLPIHHPQHRSLHAAMDVIEAMLRPNPGLLAIPEVRLRFKREVLGAIDARRMPREVVGETLLLDLDPAEYFTRALEHCVEARALEDPRHAARP